MTDQITWAEHKMQEYTLTRYRRRYRGFRGRAGAEPEFRAVREVQCDAYE